MLRLALSAVTVAAALAAVAPPAHAGCADDYLAHPHQYAFTGPESVSVSGGVVTVDTNQVVPDAAHLAGVGVAIGTIEAGYVVTFADCVT